MARVDKMRIAVHLHLYYINQLPEIISKLQNMDKAAVDYDLYVTMNTKNKLAETKILNAFPHATILQTENKGYDIAPFIHTLKSLNLNAYDYILKLHTKGTTHTNYTKLNGCRFDNALWRKILWDSMLKTPERLQKNIEIMNKNQNIGMISSKYCLTSEKHTYEKLLPQINQVMQQLNLPQTENISFVAGTMFLAKSSILKPLQQLDESAFTPTDGKIKEGTYAHVIERVFGAVITAQNHTIHGIKHDGYGKQFIQTSLKRFFYQKKTTTKGKTLIKICKIPVYSHYSFTPK